MGRKLGRLPNDPSKRRITLSALGAVGTPPATVDYYSRVPAASWGMGGNDTAGDCTCADVDHEVKALQVAAGNPEVVSTTAQVLAAYSAITGYNPADPSTDQGAVMQSVRDYWRTTGFTLGSSDDRILLFAQLDLSNHDLIKYALSRLGAVGLGINFPASAMTQFDNGQPWDVVKGARIEGGHAIALVGYDDQFWYVVTWGQVQKMTPAFFTKYVEEAWVALSQDFVNSVSGSDPFAETLHGLGEQFAQITGKPNPVPQPDPTPFPTPVPTPAPTPDADAALATALTRFLAGHTPPRYLRTAAAAWLDTQGA